MKKITIISMLAMILLIILPLATGAIENELVFKVGEEGDLRRPCFDDNNFCDSSFDCNLTVSKNDGDAFITNQQMTYNPTYYNYTFIAQDTGYYNAIMVCSDGSDSGRDTFTFLVNNSGTASTITKLWAEIFAIIVLITLAGLLIYSTLSIATFAPLKYSLGIIATIIIFVVLNLSISLLRDEVAGSTIIAFFDQFAAMSVWLYYFGIGLIIIVWIFTILYNLQTIITKKKQKRLMGI